jgi:pyridoxine 4-dehydrogenase
MEGTDMTKHSNLGGGFTLPNTSMTVNRIGYGAMQLAGPGVWGPPRDPDAAVAVLRAAVAAGVNHIDTSDYYGPHVTNQIIRQALHPYSQELVILTTLAELKAHGLIRHLGLSNVTATQVAEAQTITEIVCVQNMYNVAHREDDIFIDDLAAQGIAYVPFFPLGGFNPLQSSALNTVAASLGATPMQVALAWLLQRSPNLLLIPGTSSVEHLRENLQAATLQLPADALDTLNAIAAGSERKVHS